MRTSVGEDADAPASSRRHRPGQRPDSAARRTTWPAALVSVLLTGALYGLQFLQNPRFFFIDDRVADTLPKLVDVGHTVRAGEWPWLTTDAVNSGAHALEYLNGVFNPLLVALSVALSLMDDLALGAFLLVLVHVLLLAASAAWLGRLLGLGTAWAVAFALSCAVQPYTLLWGAAAWIQAVSSFSWFVLAVAASVAFHLEPRRRYGWILLVATYGCCTSGWPLVVPVLGVFVAVLLVLRTLRGGDRRVTVWLAAWSAGGAVCSIVALYPLTRAFEFATRTSEVSNDDNFNVVTLDGLLQFANPAYYGFLNSFDGYELLEIPHFYAAWFVLPVLAFWRAERLPAGASLLAAVSTLMLGLTALGSLGPEQLFSFRYPTRFLQYSSFFLLMTTAVLVAHARFSFTARRLRMLLAAVVLLAVLALQADPTGTARVLLTAVGIGVLSTALWRSARAAGGGLEGRGRRRPSVGAVAALGTVALLTATVLQHPDGRGIDYEFPRDVSSVPQLSRDDYTLFYGTYKPADLDDAAGFHAEYHPAGTGLMVGDRQLNGYSPIGHSAFREQFPMDDQGNFEPGTSGRFADVDRGTRLQMLELLKVDQIIALQGPWTDDLEQDLGPEWKRERTRRYTSVWRHAPYDLPGLVSYVSPGVRLGPEQPSCVQRHLRECVPLRTEPTSKGRVIFARLWFPGYAAELDGAPLPVERYNDMLVSVVVPPGSAGELVLTYRSPHVRKLAVLAALTITALALVSLRYPPIAGSRGDGPRRRRWRHHRH